MKKYFILLAACAAVFAGETHIWTQGDYADFEKGIVKNLSVRSDGLLTLAPASRELYDTSAPYLWALARDSKGNLYTGGGTGAKLFRVAPDGKGKLLAELDGLEVHAIAVDSKDRVYAGTAPDGKVYRIAGNGKPEVFYDPKAKYIWAMGFDSHGDLFVATGDQGEVDRVTPDGKGKLFFKTDETHVRSMTIDGHDNLILGTDPGGLVLRVTPAGEGFVLYQMPKKEVTAVAVAGDGAIYAAAVGSKTSAPLSAPAAPPTQGPAQVAITVSQPGVPAAGAAARPPAPPPASLGGGGVAGGSDVYRIEPSGNPERMWTSGQDVVYAIGFDGDGRVLLGAGNKGNVYRIESPTSYTALLNMPATQITAFQQGKDGRLYAATGNVGKVYEIGPALEPSGTVESQVFDAELFTLWGRASFEARRNGGQVSLETRSGNLDEPQKNWSPWSAPITSPKGGRMASPPARFVQWKATLTGDGKGHSPELESVDVAYLPKNVAPRIEEIEITPFNYKFPAPPAVSASSQPPQSLTLPPMGRQAQSLSSFSLDTATSTPALQFAKGYIGARWLASDPNGDSLSYTVEIKGEGETEWKMLKEKVNEKYFSWDSTAFPDGLYRLRILASDAPGNPPAEALTATLESEPFTIDNTPPRITGLAATRVNGKLQVRWHAADALNDLAKAEYSLDGGDWVVAAPVTQLSDSPDLDYAVNIDAPAGEHTIAVRVTDDADNTATEKVVVR
jgi:sugar lactone lactonase YvrE